jgi:hypothetical protein
VKEGTARTALLGVALIIGAGLALSGITTKGQAYRELPDGITASVNGTHIADSSFDLSLSLMGNDKRSGLSRADKKLVLDRLVDEELLLQRARPALSPTTGGCAKQLSGR